MILEGRCRGGSARRTNALGECRTNGSGSRSRSRECTSHSLKLGDLVDMTTTAASLEQPCSRDVLAGIAPSGG